MFQHIWLSPLNVDLYIKSIKKGLVSRECRTKGYVYACTRSARNTPSMIRDYPILKPRNIISTVEAREHGEGGEGREREYHTR